MKNGRTAGNKRKTAICPHFRGAMAVFSRWLAGIVQTVICGSSLIVSVIRLFSSMRSTVGI